MSEGHGTAGVTMYRYDACDKRNNGRCHSLQAEATRQGPEWRVSRLKNILFSARTRLKSIQHDDSTMAVCDMCQICRASVSDPGKHDGVKKANQLGAALLHCWKLQPFDCLLRYRMPTLEITESASTCQVLYWRALKH